MAVQALDPAAFKAQFPEFGTFADAAITAYWDMATQYMSATDGVMLSGSTLAFALNLLTAHLAKSFLIISTGSPGVVNSATEGGVSVSMTPPPVKNAWQWWLATTPYGVQLWALLQVQTAGGVFVGGSAERNAFRKAGGIF